ncbi:hypothetical protein Tco_1216591 [Tanacetum coccineum]
MALQLWHSYDGWPRLWETAFGMVLARKHHEYCSVEGFNTDAHVSLIPDLLSFDVFNGFLEVEGTAFRFAPALVLFGSGGIPATLTEVAESSHLPNKIKVVLDRARIEETSFADLMKNLCFSLRISLSKKRRLVAELEFGVRHVPSKLAEFLKEIQTKDRETVTTLQILEREMELNAISCSYGCTVLAMGEFGYGLQISNGYIKNGQRRSQNGQNQARDWKSDKMKFWFNQARTEDEGLVGVLRDLSFEIRITMHKYQRLIAELEALGERGDAVTALKAMREIVARDSAKLAVLEQLLDGTHVAIRLKEGYVADME